MTCHHRLTLRIDVAAEDRAFRVIWSLTWPLRMYLRYTRIASGRTFLRERVLAALLPPDDRTFLSHGPAGGRIRLRYREVIGFTLLLQGGFEDAEVEALVAATRPGTVAVDVGANVGIFTIPLAQAVGRDGAVWAFEPLPENVDRLTANVAENRLTNVIPFLAAAFDKDRSIPFHVADDGAFGSTAENTSSGDRGKTITVLARRLDAEWHARGMPPVSVIKIDVESAEIAVLRGAQDVIRRCRPVLLVEAADSEELATIEDQLQPLDYERREHTGFADYNHLFVPR